METLTPINKLNAARRVQQTLKNNPDDIHALLELAAMLGTLKEPDLDRKRQILHKVLSLDPVNEQARQMLLEMDRAELHAHHPQPPAQRSPTVSTPPVTEQLATPLVSRYSIIHQFLIYPLLAIAALLMLLAVGEWEVFSVFAVCFLLLLIPLWFVSAVLQVSSAGIQISRLYGVYRREIDWTEIDGIKPAVMGVGIRVSAADGGSLTISSQMSGYAAIVEILWKMRPDLFEMTGAKTFQKGFLAKYGLFFFLVPATPLALGGIFVPPFLPGILATVVIFILWRTALHGVHLVKVDENRLSTRSFRKNQEITVEQIRDINMVTVRNRRGVAKSMVQIELDEENKILLSGFSEGNEIMYGFLRNWWGAYQHS
jgi:hypothetical protein